MYMCIYMYVFVYVYVYVYVYMYMYMYIYILVISALGGGLKPSPSKKPGGRHLATQALRDAGAMAVLIWGFSWPWGYPKSWMVCFMENSHLEMDDNRGYLDLRNPF